MKKQDVTLKSYIKFVAYVICGMAVIAVVIIAISHIIPTIDNSRGFDAALMVTGVVMFWVIAAGIAFGIAWLIRLVRHR